MAAAPHALLDTIHSVDHPGHPLCTGYIRFIVCVTSGQIDCFGNSINQIVSPTIINLHQLRVFVEVVESEGFTRAAARLSMTQPAVSAQVEHLRNIAGMPLLIRDGRRVVLTDVGKVMYE